MSLKDQADLVRRLGDMRRQHKRDQRRMEDVLSGVSICVPRRVLEMFSIAYVCVIIQRDNRKNGSMVFVEYYDPGRKIGDLLRCVSM